MQPGPPTAAGGGSRTTVRVSKAIINGITRWDVMFLGRSIIKQHNFHANALLRVLKAVSRGAHPPTSGAACHVQHASGHFLQLMTADRTRTAQHVCESQFREHASVLGCAPPGICPTPRRGGTLAAGGK